MTSGKLVVEQDYIDLATSLGVSWIGPMPAKASLHTNWKCTKNHVWSGTYINLKYYKSGCPTCNIKQRSENKKLSPDAYKCLAKERGFKWVGPYPYKTALKTWWECGQGHVWEATYRDIKHGKTGCPTCYNIRRGNTLRLSSADYHTLAHTKALTWVGTFPRNTKEKTLWKCLKGHLWKATYHDIQQGNNCPYCQNRLWINGKPCSSQQKQLSDILCIPDEHINYKVGKYWLDIAYPTDKLCIEYDCFYWHDLKKDIKRDHYLNRLGWGILRIRSGNYIPDIADIISKIYKLRQGSLYEEIILKDWVE